MSRILTRRTAMIGGAALTAGGLVRPAFGQQRPPSMCVATPQATAGPFWFDPELKRSDLTEDRQGAPLDLRVNVVNADGCAPIEGARVDIWQCDAAGLYSGYADQGFRGGVDARGETFLRGWQPAEAGGAASFRTIYPGTYPIRVTHIHLKVFLDGGANALTAQIYFPEEVTRNVYRGRDLYADSLPNVRANARDRIFGRAGDTMVAEIGEQNGVMTAAVTVGVRA